MNYTLEQVETMKASAVGLGLDAGSVADIITKWGPQVLATVVEALRGGLTVHLVMEVLTNFGPPILEFLVDWFNDVKMLRFSAANAGEIVEGVDVTSTVGDVQSNILMNLLERLLERAGPELIEKILPALLDKYAPIVLQFVLDWLMGQLKSNKVSFSQ